MDRRSALKSMAITAWGLMLLPACGPDGKELPMDQVKTLPLDSVQSKNLQALVDTLLPKTDTLGAVELNIHTFIDRVLANCYELDVQQRFVSGLQLSEKKSQDYFNKPLLKVTQAQKEEILMSFDQEENEIEKEFFDQIKELALLGYTTSEYFLTNFTNYEMVPGGYDGCVPVPNEPFNV